MSRHAPPSVYASIFAQQHGVGPDSPAAQNTAGLVAACARAAARGGGTVVLPAGDLSWDGLVSVPSEVNLRGVGPYATTLLATAAAAQIRFGDGGGVTTVINYGGLSGGFRINGALATNPLFVGLCVSRSFADVDVIFALGDGLRVEQAQNCRFEQVNVARCTGSNLVLDYGAGGNTFDTTEAAYGGRSNVRITGTAPNTGGGYAFCAHNTFTNLRAEGTQLSTVACVEVEAGINVEFRASILTLLSGAAGHADLYGTAIPVLAVSKAHADAGAVTHSVYLTGGTRVNGSKPAASSVYVGIGVRVTNTPGANAANVYLADGCVIALCDDAISTAAGSRVNIHGTVDMATNTARYAPIGGAHTEATVVRGRTGPLTVTNTDSAVNVMEVYSAALVLLASMTNGGTWTQLGPIVATLLRASTLGLVGAPAFTFNADQDTGMWSPAANTLALSAGGVERLRLTNVAPSVTGSRGGNAALASLLTALATLGLVTDNTTA